MSSSLADKLQIWGFLDDIVVFGDASLGFGLNVQPLDVSCMDEASTDSIAHSLIGFINSLSPHLDVQFLQEISSGNHSVLTEFEALLQKGANHQVADLHRVRVEKLKVEDSQGLLPVYRIRIFVRRPPSGAPAKTAFLSAHKRNFEALTDTFLEREAQALRNLREEITRGLNSIGLTTSAIAQKELADIAYLQWNPSRPSELAEYSDDDVRSSLLFSDVLPSTTGFEIGGVHHRIISLKLLPDQTFSTMACALNDLPFDSRVFVSLHVPDQQKELESLQTQRRLAFSMARGKKTGVSDIESEAKFQDLESLINEMVAQGEKVFHLSLNVLLKSTDEQELHDQVSQTLQVIREMSGAEGMEESLATFDIFAELSVPNARSKERAKKVKSSNAADMLPVYAPWKGHSTPRMLLKSPSGNLVAFDPFSPTLSNYNQVITGGSGSGKSFLTNLLLLQMMKENPKLFIVDIGGSYRKLCDCLSGQYIPFDLSGGLSLNPFDLGPGETLPSSQKLKFLVGLVELMTREDEASGLGKLDRVEIEETIQRLYEAGGVLTLSRLRDALLAHSERHVNRLGRILGIWCGETPYGKIVDRPTNIRLDRSLVSFDLKGLESFPDLQAVALYLVTDFVWREVQSDRERMKVLVFDECWKLLESSVGASFIGEVFRTFRKYFASAIAISQNIDDFSKSRVASAVLPNTSVKWVLMQRGADKDRLKEVLHLNDREVSHISRLSQQRGVYSQAFLMAEDNHCVVSVEPTPIEYWMATTDPRDLALIQNRGGVADFPTLKRLAEEFPRGVASKGSEK